MGGVLEIVSYATGRMLQNRWSMYDIPKPPTDDFSFDKYISRRDPHLGWPYKDQLGSKRYNHRGARPCPSCENYPGQACVSLFGDSFTQSPQPDHLTWGNLLADRLKCPVDNFGVGGYGTDQALIRYETITPNQSEFVVLAHYSENIIRNLTRNRDFVTYQQWYALKPRFILNNEGQLQRVSIPQITGEEYQAWLDSSQDGDSFPHETFAPGGAAGVTLLKFPYTLSLLRNLKDFRMQAKMRKQPDYASFYQAGNPAQGLAITQKILERFSELAQKRQQRPLILLLPSKKDLKHYLKTGDWYYENLYFNLRESLTESGVQVLDFGPHLAQALKGRNPEVFFDATNHYVPEADALLADYVAQTIKDIQASTQVFSN